MGYPSVVNSFSRGTTVIASELNENMDNIISGLTLGNDDAYFNTIYAQTMTVSNQATINALNFGESVLYSYVTGALTLNVTTDTATTGLSFNYSIIGNLVSLRIGLLRTSLAAASLLMKTSDSLPTAIRPLKNTIFSYSNIDNNIKVQYGAYGVVGTDGIVSFYYSQTDSTNWSAPNKNNGSLFECTVTYNRG